MSNPDVNLAQLVAAIRQNDGAHLHHEVMRNFFEIDASLARRRCGWKGIRVFGHLGRTMIVRQNHIEGANVGVRFEPLGALASGIQACQWLVADNMATQSAQPVEATPKGAAREQSRLNGAGTRGVGT